MNRIWFILVASLLLLSCNKQTPEKEVLPRTQKERVRWFEEARLGIMIHWSLCTPAAGRGFWGVGFVTTGGCCFLLCCCRAFLGC